MRILFIESGEIWSNNLAKGFTASGHDVLISGPIDNENLSSMIKTFKPDFSITVGWGAEHTKDKQKIIREQMAAHKIPLVYWAVEDPAYTEAWSLPLINAIAPDFVFTICPDTVETYKQLGILASHLDFGYEETIHQPIHIHSEYKSQIAIVANAYPDILENYPNHFRHRSIDILIRPLLKENIRIDFWGNNWDKMDDYLGFKIPNEWIHGFLNYKDANKVYSSSKILLGLQNYPALLTQRTYEILGSGGFLLTLDTPGVRKNFIPRKDLVVSLSPEETIHKVHYYLNQPEKRSQIQMQGRKSVEEHSYKFRANQIISTLIENDILKTGLNEMKGKGEIIYYSPNDHYETYKVQKGDTLYKISRKFEVPIEELKTLNVLSSDLIIENQILKIRKRFV
ncbi:glycosyltransferase family protein [Neobacillus ginsengisoli]|uniref:Spore maturation protein CgeB n=1 Tax=Neobacillus ginsengisoli TaxID=904295 RepID=A0ABT9Y1G2_9BACI|nr:glycosyltransferase [Neobacillus ginsengisoli]MDQ0200984.1 spore maturation protein CgeB [Neobacillus ginsengisoli]